MIDVGREVSKVSKEMIKIKKTGKILMSFVLHDYYGKGNNCYNPIYVGGMYKKNEIEIIKDYK